MTDDDLARGVCPRCGSGEVFHLLIGMPSSPEAWGSGPDWLHWVGCVHPGHERECGACGHFWSPSVPDRPTDDL
ncbi:MAG TPA: hypothetical protein VGE14_05685 [Marmoricola sp.]